MSQFMGKWDRRGLNLAWHISNWSKDPSTKVGAVIMTPEHRPISWGYNGFPRGIADTEERLADSEVKLALTLHAEKNALAFAKGAASGCHLYVWPFPPCAQCAAEIVQHGIIRVVFGRMQEVPTRWAGSFMLGKEILMEAGVDYVDLTGLI